MRYTLIENSTQSAVSYLYNFGIIFWQTRLQLSLAILSWRCALERAFAGCLVAIYITFGAIFRDEHQPCANFRMIRKDVVHVHVSDRNRVPPRESRADWVGLMRALAFDQASR